MTKCKKLVLTGTILQFKMRVYAYNRNQVKTLPKTYLMRISSIVKILPLKHKCLGVNRKDKWTCLKIWTKTKMIKMAKNPQKWEKISSSMIRFWISTHSSKISRIEASNKFSLVKNEIHDWFRNQLVNYAIYYY